MRRIFKWAGLATSALLAVAYVLSIWWSFAWSVAHDPGPPHRWTYTVNVTCGRIDFNHVVGNIDPDLLPFHVSRYSGSFSWWFNRLGARMKGSRFSCLSIPLWAPLLLVGIPTAIAWRRDRRPPPGHCQICGYDLTGNVSGICPECGAKANSEDKSLEGAD